MRNKRIFQEEYLNSAFIILVLFLLLFSQYVVSNSLWPHELHHTRLPCPSPSPGVHPNSCPLSWWCHPTISFSVVPFSSSLQSFPASTLFPMCQFFKSVILKKYNNQSLLNHPKMICKEIQPVHPEGNQPWIFIERTDAEAEAPVLQ